MFGAVWEKISTQDGEWESGYQLWNGRLYKNSRLCVPKDLQEVWIREMHSFASHVGPDRLWSYMEVRVEWADGVEAKKIHPASDEGMRHLPSLRENEEHTRSD